MWKNRRTQKVLQIIIISEGSVVQSILKIYENIFFYIFQIYFNNNLIILSKYFSFYKGYDRKKFRNRTRQYIATSIAYLAINKRKLGNIMQNVDSSN